MDPGQGRRGERAGLANRAGRAHRPPRDTGASSSLQNGVVRQSADIGAMVWSVAEIVAHLSGYYHLGPGDLIFTGTPAGVGPVLPGDRLEGRIEGVGALSATIGPSA